MNKKYQYKQFMMFLLNIVLLLGLTVIYAYVWYSKYAYSDSMIEPFFRRGNYVVIAQYALMTFFFNKLFDNYKIGYTRIFETVFSHSLSILFVNFVTYLQLCLIGRWAFTEYMQGIFFMTSLDFMFVFVWICVTRYVFVKLYPPRDLLLIYGNYSPDQLMKKLSSRSDKYNVKEIISIDTDYEIIRNKLSQYEGVMLADIPSGIRNKLVKECFEKDIRCYSIPKISDIMIMNSSSIHLFDTSLLLFRNSGLSVFQIFWKRVMDIVFSVIGLIAASPLMILIGIMIKCYDGGPVFYYQERLTQYGKTFRIIKFRSMKVASPKDASYMTRKNDDRVTPIGKYLRSLHLDELPQLFNILKGEMSLVGPRPECPDIAAKYSEFLPEFSFRLKVKAGLTGYAQVYGKYNTIPYDKLKLDLLYIEKYSLLLDLKLILLTVKIFFWKDKSEGIDSWQTTAATKENLEQVDNK